MTGACQHCRDLIGGYVLDALEPAEREAVRRHIETCEPCAREHAELATLPSLLDAVDSADAAPLRPPPRLEEAVLDRFARESRGLPAGGAPERDRAEGARLPRRGSRPRHRRRWLLPGFAAAAVCAAALALGIALVADSDNGTGAGQRQAHVYRVAMNGDGPTPAAVGEAKLYPGETGTGVHLEVSGLKPHAFDYELWCVRDDGWKVSAGTFRVDSTGHADVHLTTAANPKEYDGLSIQARPAGKSADTNGVRVLTGRLKS